MHIKKYLNIKDTINNLALKKHEGIAGAISKTYESLNQIFVMDNWGSGATVFVWV
jgi:hypothetical protein